MQEFTLIKVSAEFGAILSILLHPACVVKNNFQDGPRNRVPDKAVHTRPTHHIHDTPRSQYIHLYLTNSGLAHAKKKQR